MPPAPKLLQKGPFIDGELVFKLYVFDSARPTDKAISYFRSVLPHTREGDELGTHDRAGVAFLYGYSKKDGLELVPGTDLVVWKNFSDENAMLLSWRYENGMYIHRERGTCCGTEIEIIAAENRLRRSHRDDIQQYLTRWPNLEGIIEVCPSLQMK